jgi:alpha-ribazole phosphatase/probable phosphoglycerate mutase
VIALPERGGATRLVLVRHTEPDESVRGRCYGRLDVPLSAAGLRHAAAIGEALWSHEIAAVYSSPLQRALDTARAVASPHGLEPLPRDDLRELDFGELEGMHFDEIAAEHPELYRSWMDTPFSVRFPGGEGLVDLRGRVLPEVAQIRARHEGETVALVTHGGVVRVVLAEALELPDTAFFRLDQPYGALSVVDWVEGVPVVRIAGAVLYSPS